MGWLGNIAQVVLRGLVASGVLDRLSLPMLRLLAQQGRMPALAAAALPRVVIVGEGGVGKSTILKQLLASAGRSGRVPVWVPLVSLPDEGPLTIASLVDHLVRQAQSVLGQEDVNAAFFESAARDGRLTIGFDALDECGPLVRRQRTRGLIAEVAREWKRCQVFVTSRPEALRETPLPLLAPDKLLEDEAGVEFLAFEPVPFSRDDVTPFLRAAFVDGDRLAQELLGRTGIEALLETPLTLTLVGLVARSSTTGLPASPTQLFAQCLRTVCETWEDAKGPGSARDGLDALQRLDVLRRLGWEAQQGKSNTVSALAARRMLARVPAYAAAARAEAIVDGLASRNLLLRAETAGPGGLEVQRIGFAHPQFREYLAGAHFAAQIALDADAAAATMAAHWFDSAWLGVLRFAMTTVEHDAELRDELLRAASSAADPYRDLLHRAEFLVADLLARLASADAAVVSAVAECLEQAAITEPALRDEAARKLLALAPHASVKPAIRRFAQGKGAALAFFGDAAGEHGESFAWRLRAIEALAAAGAGGEARTLALELPTHGFSSALELSELRARLGDRDGALEAWKRTFDSEDPGARRRIGESMDSAGAAREFDAWLRDVMAGGQATIDDARLARQRGVQADYAVEWGHLFGAAADALATLDANVMFAPPALADAVYAALDADIPGIKDLPAHRRLVVAAMRHPAFAWLVADKARAIYPELRAEAIERLTRYVLDGSSADGDHSRVRCAVLAVRDEPDSSLAVPALLQLLQHFDPWERWWQAVASSLALRGQVAAGLRVLEPMLALPAGVSDRNPDGLERRRDTGWRIARRLEPTQAWRLLDAMYRGGDADAQARRLANVWSVSGVSAIARDWFDELAREGADPDGRVFLRALLTHEPDSSSAGEARRALHGDLGGVGDGGEDEEFPAAWTLADEECAFRFALQNGFFIDEHDHEEEASVDNLLGLLHSIAASSDPATAQRHADEWMDATAQDERLAPADKAHRMAAQLDGLSRMGFRSERWLEAAARSARSVAPAQRVKLVQWLSANA